MRPAVTTPRMGKISYDYVIDARNLPDSVEELRGVDAGELAPEYGVVGSTLRSYREIAKKADRQVYVVGAAARLKLTQNEKGRFAEGI